MPETFQPQRSLQLLAAREVDYALIGGRAATLHGSPHLTRDVDLTPDRSLENPARLSDALRELAARVRARGAERLPFSQRIGRRTG